MEISMLDTLKLVKSMWTDRRGVTAVEYAVVAAGIVAVVVVAFGLLGAQVGTIINGVTSKIS
jgi:Flp pilus assembly pilin Flp